jgi:hypothetical protein
MMHLGSSYSMRAFSRLGSGASLHGYFQVGSAYGISLVEYGKMGSSLSIRSTIHVNSGNISVLHKSDLGSSLSIRHKLSRCYAGNSVLSIFAMGVLGSSVSLRSNFYNNGSAKFGASALNFL